jgi:predicted dienelactone hydrolase
MATGMRASEVFKGHVGLMPVILLLCIASTAQAAPPWNIGYRKIDVQDGLSGDSFPVALWYPTPAVPVPLFVTGSLSPCRLPVILCRRIAFEMSVAPNAPLAAGTFGVIVVSHGSGGLALNHRGLAMALASHGYVVAAPTHPRGKGNDISGVGVWVGRPKQVSRVIDTVLEDGAFGPHIERERIGVVGHSNGGYTALAVAGAKPTTSAAAAHCREHPDDANFCTFGGAATREATREVGHIPDLRDPRARSIVLMAPNATPFTDDALAKVTVPVLVYAAENDDLTRVRYHAERLARSLPQTECVVVKGAGHFSFVASFPTALRIVAGEAARDPAGFDRDALHEVMNREIVGYFNRTLRPAGATLTKGAQPASCRSRELRGARSSRSATLNMSLPRNFTLQRTEARVARLGR